jgi:hypothetical protein
MTALGQRDHLGALVEPGAPEPSRPAMGRQFTLLQLMKAIAIVGVALAVAVRRPDLIVDPRFYLILWILAAGLYGLSWFPLRVRLAVELAVACGMLILAAWNWRPPFYLQQADRSEELAGLCSRMAETTSNPPERDLYLREADRYGRWAFELRMQAMWYGLVRSATKPRTPVPMTGRDLILDIRLRESRDRYSRLAETTGIPGVQLPP